VESVSGDGSKLRNTETLRKELPILFEKYNIKSMIDLPCGDWNWMRKIDLSNIKYYGFDIVEDLIKENRKKYPNIDFEVKNGLEDSLPQVDLIMCRDLIIHFPLEEIFKLLNNFVKSNSKYLLITRFDGCEKENKNIEFGDFAMRNLQLEPFNLPEPLIVINDKDFNRYNNYNNTDFEDAKMVLYKLENIRDYISIQLNH
jgi:hypothetical protein